MKKQKKGPASVVGLCFDETAWALAEIGPFGKSQVLRQFFQSPTQSREDQETNAILLKNTVTQLGLRNRRSVVLLPAKAYQVFLIERPNVPESEMKSAIRWKISEYSDIPVEEAVVDFIELPHAKNADNPSLCYAVIAKKQTIDELVMQVSQAGLSVEAVDISQSALRYIALKLEETNEGQALLHVQAKKSHLILFQDRSLIMMREIEMGLEDLQQQNSEQALASEIQRSLDYCSSKLSHHDVSRLLITPLVEKQPSLLSHLSNALGLPVREIVFSEFLSNLNDNELKKENMTTLAIGAALRNLN